MNVETLRSFCPAAVPFWPGLRQAFDRFGIITDLRVAHFMAQVAHESAGFTTLEENLRYSATLLLKTWPARFDSRTAIEYQRNPERIANRVYANRMGNGPEDSGDGWLYRGRGLIQLTGRDNYARCGESIGLDLIGNPRLAASVEKAPVVAGWFWDSRQLNKLADADDLVSITQRINGGTNGIDDRAQWLVKAKAAVAL